MRTDVVITVTGPDRVGIVEEVAQALLAVRGNIGTSRMARLGGEFAILMHAEIPSGSTQDLEAALSGLAEQGYHVTLTPTRSNASIEQSSWATFRVDVEGADHEGIVHEIVRGLSQMGISIEAMETGTADAPTTGVTLFTMSAIVAVPPGVEHSAWRSELDAAAEASNVDVDVYPLS